jgi:hypothetical protein
MANSSAVPAAGQDVPLLWAKGEDGQDLIHSSEEELRYVFLLGVGEGRERGVDCYAGFTRRLVCVCMCVGVLAAVVCVGML